MHRFYIEGYEIDVQDPTFFTTEEKLKETEESISNLLELYD